MAINPFDPPVVQLKQALARGGLSGANRGFGSIRMPPSRVRPAPSVTSLRELQDVSTAAPGDATVLVYDISTGLYAPAAISASGTSASANFVSLALWEMTHALGFMPAVTTVDTDGNVLEGDVDYVSSTIIQVTHGSPLSGTMYLS